MIFTWKKVIQRVFTFSFIIKFVRHAKFRPSLFETYLLSKASYVCRFFEMQGNLYWGVPFLWIDLHIFPEIYNHGFSLHWLVIDGVAKNILVIFVPFMLDFLNFLL